MRTHRQIIEDGGGAAKVAKRLTDDGGVEVEANTIYPWVRTDSIPGHYWPAFERADLATIVELAAHAEAKRLTPTPTEGEAA